MFDGALALNYVSRSYMTRHGAGPLEKETIMPDFVVDTTNITNDYQGSLRYAPLDIEALRSRVAIDAMYGLSDMYTTTNIVITCIDQLNNDL